MKKHEFYVKPYWHSLLDNSLSLIKREMWKKTEYLQLYLLKKQTAILGF